MRILVLAGLLLSLVGTSACAQPVADFESQSRWHAPRVELGPRPFFLMDEMRDGP